MRQYIVLGSNPEHFLVEKNGHRSKIYDGKITERCSRREREPQQCTVSSEKWRKKM